MEKLRKSAVLSDWIWSHCEYEGLFIIIIIISISIIVRRIIQLIQLAFVAAGVMALGIFEMADSRLSFGQTSH